MNPLYRKMSTPEGRRDNLAAAISPAISVVSPTPTKRPASPPQAQQELSPAAPPQPQPPPSSAREAFLNYCRVTHLFGLMG